MSADTVRIRRVYPVPVERVYQAWTDPRIMGSWFYVGDHWTAEVENDLRIGGTFTIAMRTDQGEALVSHGIYRELEPPRRLSFTWNSHLHQGSLVTIDMRPVEGGTELTLTHMGLPSEELVLAHNRGWLGCLGNLERAAGRNFGLSDRH